MATTVHPPVTLGDGTVHPRERLQRLEDALGILAQRIVDLEVLVADQQAQARVTAQRTSTVEVPEPDDAPEPNDAPAALRVPGSRERHYEMLAGECDYSATSSVRSALGYADRSESHKGSPTLASLRAHCRQVHDRDLAYCDVCVDWLHMLVTGPDGRHSRFWYSVQARVPVEVVATWPA